MLLERLAFQTKRTPQQLLGFSASAGRFYKVFNIEKRSGGLRKIEQPSKGLKAIQRWLDRALFRHYPIHPAAMGYRKGLSIRDNAIMHASYPYTLRMDFQDFFWSFTVSDVTNFFNEQKPAGIDISNDDVNFVAGIVSRGGRLVMGAPSSPALTNIMMYKIDSALEEVASIFEAQYTRYADDLFFSSTIPGTSREIENLVAGIVKQFTSPKLTINIKKTSYLSRKSLRMVTGLVITPQGDVSLGRDRKRMIKSLLHRAINEQLDPEKFCILSGLLNWSKSADAMFVNALRLKYGSELVEKFSNNQTTG